MYSNKGVSCYSCTDSSLVAITNIFLFKTLFLDVVTRGVSDLRTLEITDLIRSSSIMMTRRWKWNWRVFVKLELGGFNDDNP